MRRTKRGAKRARDDINQTQLKFGAGGLGLQAGRVLTDHKQMRLPFKPQIAAPPTQEHVAQACAARLSGWGAGDTLAAGEGDDADLTDASMTGAAIDDDVKIVKEVTFEETLKIQRHEAELTGRFIILEDSEGGGETAVRSSHARVTIKREFDTVGLPPHLETHDRLG
jgi:hypothetical protein